MEKSPCDQQNFEWAIVDLPAAFSDLLVKDSIHFQRFIVRNPESPREIGRQNLENGALLGVRYLLVEGGDFARAQGVLDDDVLQCTSQSSLLKMGSEVTRYGLWTYAAQAVAGSGSARQRHQAVTVSVS